MDLKKTKTSFKLSNRQELLLDKLKLFYTPSIMEILLPIINGETKLSLRIIDWFVTNYTKKNNIILYNKKKKLITKKSPKNKFEQKTKKSKYRANLKILKRIKKITKIPIVAIGGINSDNYKKLLLNNANFLAISGYIWNNKKLKPEEATKKLK